MLANVSKLLHARLVLNLRRRCLHKAGGEDTVAAIRRVQVSNAAISAKQSAVPTQLVIHASFGPQTQIRPETSHLSLTATIYNSFGARNLNLARKYDSQGFYSFEIHESLVLDDGLDRILSSCMFSLHVNTLDVCELSHSQHEPNVGFRCHAGDEIKN